MEVKNTKKRRLLWILSYGYLIIPIIIFMVCWVRPLISVPVSFLIIYSFFLIIKTLPNSNVIFSNNQGKIILIFLLLLVWTVYSGVGGLMWQNRWDHMYRNALFKDLVSYQWPVVNHMLSEPRTLCYYIGFWMPSALIGKLFGYQVGYFFQLVWAYAGVLLAFLLLSEYLKKISFRVALLFVFFSGLDIVIYLLYKIKFHESAVIFSELLKGEHIELILGKFNSSSNTTLLFWLYNQSIPFWVGFLLLLQQNCNRNRLFTFMLMVLFAPFQAVALVPFVIYQFLHEFKQSDKAKYNKIKKFLCDCITIQNLTGFVVSAIIALYFMSNTAVQKIGISVKNAGDFVQLLLFLASEYVVYLVLIHKSIRRDGALIVLITTMIVYSFIQLGDSNDFAWRTCIPSTFYLLILVMKNILQKVEKLKWKRVLLIIVILVGFITPLMEFVRTSEHTAAYYLGSKSNEDNLTSDGLKSVFDPSVCYDNFIGTQNSIFGQYLELKR